MTFFKQLMEPGGGVMLIPFVRVVIFTLLCLTLLAAFLDVARLHMVILSFLCGGLFLSLQFFESEYNKLKSGRSSASSSSQGGGPKNANAADDIKKKPAKTSVKTD